MQHLFYWSLDKRYPSRDIRTVVRKIIIDQSTCTPIGIAVFIYGLGILENKPWSKVHEEFLEKFLVIFSVSCIIDCKYCLLLTGQFFGCTYLYLVVAGDTTI